MGDALWKLLGVLLALAVFGGLALACQGGGCF